MATKSLREYHRRRDLFKSILVSTTTEETSTTPWVREFIFDELVNGTIEYIGGEAGKIRYQDGHPESPNFERSLAKCLREEIEKNPKILPAMLRDYLLTMVDHTFTNPTCINEGETNCELYGHLAPIPHLYAHSRSRLDSDLIAKVRNEILPSFSEREKKAIVGIGKAMRVFMNKDLEYIAKTYHW
jgi:hypothetical protein